MKNFASKKSFEKKLRSLEPNTNQTEKILKIKIGILNIDDFDL